MKTLVIHDSLYGNTQLIAQSIAGAIPGEVKMGHVDEAPAFKPGVCDLLILGGPTHGGGLSEPLKMMLKKIEPASLTGTIVAAFDTRLTWWWIRPFGFAAPKIAKRLKKKGGKLLVEGEGFYVTGGEGPLKVGEIERAATWAETIVSLALHPQPHQQEKVQIA